MVLTAGVEIGARGPVSSPMIPRFRVFVDDDEDDEEGDAPAAEVVADVAEPALEEVPVEDFDDELQAATPATNTAAATALSACFPLNRFIVEPLVGVCR
jgi:hypothetical protein